jgi:hypothetical protein
MSDRQQEENQRKTRKAQKPSEKPSPAAEISLAQSLDSAVAVLKGSDVELDDDECHRLATVVEGAAHRLAAAEHEISLLQSKLAIAVGLPPEDNPNQAPADASLRQQIAAIAETLSSFTRCNSAGLPERANASLSTPAMPTPAEIAEYARSGAPSSIAGPGRPEFAYNMKALAGRMDPMEPNPVLRALIAKRLYWQQTWTAKATNSEYFGFAAIQQQRPSVVLHASLWKPIACGEFLDFGRLVDVANGCFKTARLVLAIEDDALVNKSSADSQPIPDYRTWAACFSLYRSATTFLYPERATELQLYQQHFLEVCGEFQFPECLAYDQYRRHLFSLDPRIPLSLPQLHLHGKYLINRIVMPTPPSDRRPKKRPLPDDAAICDRFNNGRCRSNDCKFRHVCKRCGGNHPIRRCPEPKPERPGDVAADQADQPVPPNPARI